MTQSAREQAEAFLAIADQFRLGDLPTEQPHPLTTRLSTLARDDLAEAFHTLKEVDRLALASMEKSLPRLKALAGDIHLTLKEGGRIFIAGCGATGRLALTLEVLCREGLLDTDSVIGFMAGGDAALIRSLEGFEDFPDYGARQLLALGYSSHDLMIAVTEGGETPFVIGATEAARDLGGRPPWFCYCNPDDILCRVVERSQRVLLDPGIMKCNLSCGPMALAGSTRMQATTVQMAGIGLALSCYHDPEAIEKRWRELMLAQANTDYHSLAPLTVEESLCARSGIGVLYQGDDFGMTVLTDTTERSPTFSLPPFENTQSPGQPASLCYLCLKQPDAATAWRSLLGREPRTLEWPEVVHVAGRAYLMGYDISQNALAHRSRKLGADSRLFKIESQADGLFFSFSGKQVLVTAPQGALGRNLILKMLLNAHSTLLMGRLGRYEGNLMTWVRSSNNKLIDRAIRYVRILAKARHGLEPDYATVCYALFQAARTIQADEAIVLKTLALLPDASLG